MSSRTSYAEYFASPGINWSRLKLLRDSPFHYANVPTRTETAALRVGLAAHTLVLEPHKFGDEYAVWETGTRRGKAWDAFKAEHEGKTLLNQTEYTRARNCSAAILGQPVAMQILNDGVSERAITWTDAETNMLCKGRPDHANGRCIDIKTTAVIQPRRFAALAARLGYHCQLAFYHDGLVATGHVFTDEPALVVVQSEPPYDVIVYDVPEAVMDAGRREYRRLLRLLVECEDTDSWPGIARGERMQLVLPEWAYTEWDEDMEPLTMGGKAMVI